MVDDEGSQSVGSSVGHFVVLFDLFDVGQVAVDDLLFFPEVGHGVADLVDHVGEDDDAEHLDDGDHHDLEVVLGTDVPVADGEDGRGGKVERSQVDAELVGRVDIEGR